MARNSDKKQAERSAKFESTVRKLAAVRMHEFYPKSAMGIWPTPDRAPDYALVKALLAELEALDQVGTSALWSAQSSIISSDSLRMRK